MNRNPCQKRDWKIRLVLTILLTAINQELNALESAMSIGNMTLRQVCR
jgi:hypothetical protein